MQLFCVLQRFFSVRQVREACYDKLSADMRLLGCSEVGPAEASNAIKGLLWSFALISSLILSAEAFIDIRAPASSDAATVETQPQEQVHIVFSSHLVGYIY